MTGYRDDYHTTGEGKGAGRGERCPRARGFGGGRSTGSGWGNGVGYGRGWRVGYGYNRGYSYGQGPGSGGYGGHKLHPRAATIVEVG